MLSCLSPELSRRPVDGVHSAVMSWGVFIPSCSQHSSVECHLCRFKFFLHLKTKLSFINMNGDMSFGVSYRLIRIHDISQSNGSYLAAPISYPRVTWYKQQRTFPNKCYHRIFKMNWLYKAEELRITLLFNLGSRNEFMPFQEALVPNMLKLSH